jgi:exo-beta-1,3-glucanase (GH17 family)
VTRVASGGVEAGYQASARSSHWSPALKGSWRLLAKDDELRNRLPLKETVLVRTTRFISGAGLLFITVLLAFYGPAPAGAFVGIDYGPFHKSGQMPGTPIPDSQFKADLKVLSQKFTYIKTYGDDEASNLDRVVPIAAAQFPQLKIYQGVFENAAFNSSADATYLDTAISLANTYPKTVAAIVVGNECLDTDSNPDPISVSQLIADLHYVRTRLKANGNVKVTTELGYQAAVQYGGQLEPYVDSMMINIYPFYAPVPINGAISNLIGAYNMFRSQFSGKQVIIGETGWPSAGDPNGSAIPSVTNEAIYTRQNFSNSNQLGSNFLFSAFDEPWLISQNSWGPHWGLWNSSGSPKFPLTISKPPNAWPAPALRSWGQN